jgi:hypothetical protein
MSSFGTRTNNQDHDDQQEEETNSSNYAEPLGTEQEKRSSGESDRNEESMETEKTQEDGVLSDKDREDNSNFRLVF